MCKNLQAIITIIRVKPRLYFLFSHLLFYGIWQLHFYFLLSRLFASGIHGNQIPFHFQKSHSTSPFYSNCFALALLDSCRATQSVFPPPPTSFTLPHNHHHHHCNPKLVAPSLFRWQAPPFLITTSHGPPLLGGERQQLDKRAGEGGREIIKYINGLICDPVQLQISPDSCKVCVRACCTATASFPGVCLHTTKSTATSYHIPVSPLLPR